MRNFNVGRFNKRIELINVKNEINENGFQSKITSSIGFRWCAVSSLYGSEFWNAKAINHEHTLIFTMRYDPTVKLDMNILFENNVYEIIFIDNVKFENKILKVKAVRIGNHE